MTKSVFLYFAILLTVVVLFSFVKRKHESFVEYFVNPDLGNTNYRDFESQNGTIPKMIFKQMISDNDSSDNGILMEYIFLTGDSVPISGGIEKITQDKIEILEQHIFINGKKIQAEITEGNIWKMSNDFPIPVSIKFLDDRTGFKIRSKADTYARFIDTLGQKSFIVELKSEITTFLNDKPLDTMLSTSKRWYVKNKGLIYHGEKTNGQSGQYYLKENKPKEKLDIYQLGLPEINRKWEKEDLQQAFKVLKEVKKQDTFSLPRLEDDRTSTVFEKMMNSVPSVNIKDTLNLFDQFDNYGKYIKVLPDLLELYGGVSNGEQIFYSNEFVEILKKTLNETANCTELLFDHYLVGKEGSQEAINRTAKHNGGAVKVFDAILNMMMLQNFRLEDRLELASSFSDNLKKIWKNMRQEYKTDLKNKVTYFSKEGDFPEVQVVLSKLDIELNTK